MKTKHTATEWEAFQACFDYILHAALAQQYTIHGTTTLPLDAIREAVGAQREVMTALGLDYNLIHLSIKTLSPSILLQLNCEVDSHVPATFKHEVQRLLTARLYRKLP